MLRIQIIQETNTNKNYLEKSTEEPMLKIPTRKAIGNSLIYILTNNIKNYLMHIVARVRQTIGEKVNGSKTTCLAWEYNEPSY